MAPTDPTGEHLSDDQIRTTVAPSTTSHTLRNGNNYGSAIDRASYSAVPPFQTTRTLAEQPPVSMYASGSASLSAPPERPIEWPQDWEDFAFDSLMTLPNGRFDLEGFDGGIGSADFSLPDTFPETDPVSAPAEPRLSPAQMPEHAAQTGRRDATINFLAQERDSFVVQTQPATIEAVENSTRKNKHHAHGDRPIQSTATVNGELSTSASGDESSNVRPLSKIRRIRNDNNGARRQRFENHEDRFETARTRKIGACLRCHLLRTRCVMSNDNLKAPCETCARALGASISRLPCVRYKISDALLYNVSDRPQAIWSSRWKSMKVVDLKVWESIETKGINVTQDVGTSSFHLTVRRFIPTPADVLHRKWKANGVQILHECTPYAIASMQKGGRELMRHIADSVEAAIECYTSGSDALLAETYQAALKHSRDSEYEDQRSLLTDTLQLWNAVRNTSRSDRICSDETLGIRVQDYDPERNNYGHVPLPPIMSAQIEILLTVNILRPLKTRVQKTVQRLIEEGRTKHWFAIYLSVFMLLHSCAMLTSFENKQSRKFGLKTRYVYPRLVEELHIGARTMLAWFHHCNKGSQPFSLDWSDITNLGLAELNPEQTQFVERTASLVKERRGLFQRVRDTSQFEHDMFFLSQLYDLDWQPIPTI